MTGYINTRYPHISSRSLSRKDVGARWRRNRNSGSGSAMAKQKATAPQRKQGVLGKNISASPKITRIQCVIKSIPDKFLVSLVMRLRTAESRGGDGGGGPGREPNGDHVPRRHGSPYEASRMTSGMPTICSGPPTGHPIRLVRCMMTVAHVACRGETIRTGILRDYHH